MAASAADEYKLTYFNVAGLGEPIRFLFSYAGVKFEDDRIDIEIPNWEEYKKTLPWESLPLLTINGDKTLSQASAICRYLAKKHNLLPKDPFDAAIADELAEAFGDLREEWNKFFYESDDDKKEKLEDEFIDKTIPKYFSSFETFLKDNGGKCFCGDKISWIDLFVIANLEFFEKELLEEYPLVKNLQDSVCALPGIKEYLETRPPGQNPFFETDSEDEEDDDEEDDEDDEDDEEEVEENMKGE